MAALVPILVPAAAQPVVLREAFRHLFQPTSHGGWSQGQLHIERTQSAMEVHNHSRACMHTGMRSRQLLIMNPEGHECTAIYTCKTAHVLVDDQCAVHLLGAATANTFPIGVYCLTSAHWE